MNDTKQSVSEKSPEYLAATLREVAETLTDVGKTIDARLGAWAEAAPEPKPPSVEVMSAATGALRRYKSITSFVRRGAMWEVYGDTTVGGGTVHTMTTPFAIWQECIAAGVPCCDPPYADLTLNIGDRWRVFSIMELRVSPRTGNSFIRCIGNRPDYGARYAVENTYYVTESPDAIRALCDAAGVPCPPTDADDARMPGGDNAIASATTPPTVILHGQVYDDSRFVWARIDGISARPNGCAVGGATLSEHRNVSMLMRETPEEVRALCAEAGVPCPEEEKPKTVSIQTLGNFTVKFAAITSITAAWDDGRACLRVVGDGNSMTHVFTTTPLADIRKQAAEAGIELPEVTVQLGTTVTLTFSAITRIYIDASLRQRIAGKRADYDKPDTGYGTCGATIPQVLALCKLAGWPKPEVRCVFTFCDGEPCEVDPASVCSVDTIRLPGERSTLVTCEDGGTSCFVRESVAVVEAMRDACKEGE